MPRFDILRRAQLSDTFRVKAVLGTFDMKPDHADVRLSGEIDIDNTAWQIGAIVGRSGTGKSTIARTLWPGAYYRRPHHKGASVIDDFPKDVSCQRVFEMLYKVGLGSPPCWLRPFSALSCGEQMRVDCVDGLLRYPELLVLDEFTSVVDRRVAQIASAAIGKLVRKSAQKVIVVSCHRDFVPWLQPDWVFDTDDMRLSKKNGADLSLILNSASAAESFGPFLGHITI